MGVSKISDFETEFCKIPRKISQNSRGAWRGMRAGGEFRAHPVSGT